jgi:hypothetical protein
MAAGGLAAAGGGWGRAVVGGKGPGSIDHAVKWPGVACCSKREGTAMRRRQ